MNNVYVRFALDMMVTFVTFWIFIWLVFAIAGAVL
jgi:hypothetical protein